MKKSIIIFCLMFWAFAVGMYSQKPAIEGAIVKGVIGANKAIEHVQRDLIKEIPKVPQVPQIHPVTVGDTVQSEAADTSCTSADTSCTSADTSDAYQDSSQEADLDSLARIQEYVDLDEQHSLFGDYIPGWIWVLVIIIVLVVVYYYICVKVKERKWSRKVVDEPQTPQHRTEQQKTENGTVNSATSRHTPSQPTERNTNILYVDSKGVTKKDLEGKAR